MEFPNLGQHCSKDTCKRLDFLPVKCDACSNIFCSDHMSYRSHQCQSTFKINIQVPICPLCNKPVPTPKGQESDYTVGLHIDNDCRMAEGKKVFTNHCTVSKCRGKEAVPVVCSECHHNYCFKHRHPLDHNCIGNKRIVQRKIEIKNRLGTSSVVKKPFTTSSIQGNLSEDEALARALAESERLNQRTMNDQEQKCSVS
ncbi:AN1-type zinc finger protein 2A-like [Daktulosphaira vitifoliae]|uniref:AN1-type zinc finger protein 2A-like n=1 Tax=Daktulosphaira vitifoliae TaxID=58002 RepID=UPI0021A9B73C|nr:AN1-type zinc finger protein 2A-like [Daktulosphaira vitifoliae]